VLLLIIPWIRSLGLAGWLASYQQYIDIIRPSSQMSPSNKPTQRIVTT
jgi:hypothetical protein